MKISYKLILKNEFKTSRFAIDYLYETFRYKYIFENIL